MSPSRPTPRCSSCGSGRPRRPSGCCAESLRAARATVRTEPVRGTRNKRLEAAMAPRVNSELLLVGSLPTESTESALRAAAELFGDLAFALPDGETGPRAQWVAYEQIMLTERNSDI